MKIEREKEKTPTGVGASMNTDILRIDGAKLVTVICVDAVVGKGTPTDPVKGVKRFYTANGFL